MSLGSTDAYKLTMAEAGYPLREECFTYTHRRGGVALLPFDVHAEVQRLLPAADAAACDELERVGIRLSAGTRAALALPDRVRVQSLPEGAWFAPGEPVFSVIGPSALVSFLEPQLLMLAYRIQLATLALVEPARLAAEVGVVSCAQQREIVLSCLDGVRVAAPEVRVDAEGYRERVFERASALVHCVEDPARLFEIGLRAATCLEQHLLALDACKCAGITRTSHVGGARTLGLGAVGTMGHEHVQRFFSDPVAFAAMRDRVPGPVSYLLDTFDTLRSGLPAAYALMQARGTSDSVRFDSGDKEAQLRAAVALARAQDLEPTLILEDGFDLEQTVKFEGLRRKLGWAAAQQLYGYGGYLVSGPAAGTLKRDRVAAVFKLAETGGRASMKFADAPGGQKQSVPGRPVVFRRVAGEGSTSLIGQSGELPPPGMRQLTEAESPFGERPGDARPELSPATQALVRALTVARDRRLAEVQA